MLEPNHFNRLLSNPETTVEEDLQKLEQLLEEFPYLQSARALQLKIYKEKNSELYNEALRKTAAHTLDRDVLFQFITSELFTETNKSESENTKEESTSTQEVFTNSETKTSETETLETNTEADTANADEIHVKPKDIISSEEIDVTPTKTLVEGTQEEKTVEPEETLELNKPLSFNKEDTYSFAEWMQLTKRKPIDRSPEESETSEVLKKEKEDNKVPKTDKVIDLVDAFLKNNPRPKRGTEVDDNDFGLSTENSEAPKSLMTETLARVYLQQKNYKKAIQAYKILILKNPEKSGYFADKIRAIEKLINKK